MQRRDRRFGSAGIPTSRHATRNWRALRRVVLVLGGACMLLTPIATPSGAITGGQPDEGRHPYVGGTVLFFAPRNETIVNCTGSLISPTVFLTAAHCGRHATRREVSFDEVFNAETSPRHPGWFYVHPNYDPNRPYDNDVAVIVLDNPVPGVDGSTPLPILPTPRLLDRMKADGSLSQSTRFTSVGYGFLGFDMGPGGPTRVRGQARHYSVGSFNALAPEQLHLSQNGARDDGGTCNGDSGGPNFLGAGEGETRIIAGLTSTGDTYCKATNVTYRLDTETARQFLGQFVTLPV
jgi:hypothetical protein